MRQVDVRYLVLLAFRRGEKGEELDAPLIPQVVVTECKLCDLCSGPDGLNDSTST